MTAPIQMTQYTLNALKGWPQPAAVDFHTTYDPTVLAAGAVLPGTVVHLSPAGQYLLGVGNVVCMPMFMFSGSNDPSVSNDGGDPTTVKGVFIPIEPAGEAMALVAVGAYELVSTAYDTGGTFTPNTLLSSPTSGANAGKLTVGVLATNTICGVVSRGIVDNGYGYNALAFWPVFIPAGV